jgi:hypothetical protein
MTKGNHYSKGKPDFVIDSRKLLSVAAEALLGLTLAASAGAQEPQAADFDATQANAAQVQTQNPAPAKAPAPATDDEGWHFNVTPYLWFAGAHGTVGARGRDASMHASPGDLLSHLDIGVVGAAEVRRNRFLLNGDLLWIRISDSKALPFPALAAVSADVRVGELVWTSKAGYRVIDHKKFKADANVGVRYWHLGQRLNFNPSLLGLNLTASQQWADIIVGGRIQLPVGKKSVIEAGGDVGGWNATAKLDYQFAALLGYNVCPKWTLLAGYRYLFVDYTNSSRGAVFSVVTSGAIIGAAYHFK